MEHEEELGTVLVVDAARETIGNDVGLALDVFDLEVVLGDHVLPAGLTTGEARLRLEVVQRLVVGHHGELGAVEVGSPGLEGADDREEFLFVSRVASLGGLHLLGEVGDGLQAFALVLHEHGADGESRGISVNDEGQLGVGEDEHRVTLHGVLEGLGRRWLEVSPHVKGTLSWVSSESGAAILLKSLMNLR